MTDAPAILLIESNAGDRALCTLLLQRDLPQASVTAVSGALALADALVGTAPDAAVIACDVAWADTAELMAVVKRRAPSAAVILLGHDADLMERVIGPGTACDGVARKSSAGFLALPGIVAEALARRGRQASPPARDAAEAPPAAPSRSDQEMREIALVFSHDLREPVQQIERLARRGQTGDEGPEAASALQHVLRSSERVNQMLDDMVEYLSVTSRSVAPKPVDLNACLKQAMGNLRTVIEETYALVRPAELPTTTGDESQLVHLFQNLLSNAIKFRSTKPPVVTIACEPRDGQWLLSFRDNGIGIPQEFTERIFELGRRLHTREEYPGSGIGLALCRRIVERHGGRIWAESQQGEGATFHVLLPRAQGDIARAGGDGPAGEAPPPSSAR